MKSSNFFILSKHGEGFVSTNIMPLIHTYRYGWHHISNIIAYAVIIVTNQTEKNTERHDKTCQGTQTRES